MSVDSLVLLKDLEHLEDLKMLNIDEGDADDFRAAMQSFGDRLKTLRLEHFDEVIVSAVVELCPNLESFTMTLTSDSPDFEISSLAKLSNLCVLKCNFESWSDDEIMRLLDGLPKLRNLECEVDWFYNKTKRQNFETVVKRKFPNVFLDFNDNVSYK